MKRNTLIIVLSLFCVSHVCAKKDSVNVKIPAKVQPYAVIPMKDWEALNEKQTESIDAISILNTKIDSLVQHIQTDSLHQIALQNKLDSLIQQNQELSKIDATKQEQIKRLEADTLKLHNQTQQAIQKAELVQQEAEKIVASTDTMAIKFMLMHLKVKCTSAMITDVQKQFDNIHDVSLKNTYKDRLHILSLYMETYNKLKELARRELNSKQITNNTDAIQARYISDYKKALATLPYVKQYYKKKPTSSYLNNMLDITYEALETKNMELLNEVMKL